MKNYEIEKDLTLEKYIVWEVYRNYRIERYRGTKANCESFIKRKERKNGSNRKNS